MITYKESGVNIEAGYEVVKRVKKLAKSTFEKGVLGEIGLFGGCFRVPKGYKELVLVSGTDGVGTKLKIAFMMGKHDTVGIDLVAMNVDDVVTLGAKPIFFLDYIACHKIVPDIIENILKGIVKGCRMAGCSLIGGETAEMSDLYKEGEYDLAGFAVGIVEKKKIINGSKIKVGDQIIGLGSSGLHSNGYTLARKVLFDIAKLKVDDHLQGLKKPLGEELLEPTKIYTKSILKLIDKVEVKGIAHITGGGFPENVGRILPPSVNVLIYSSTWRPQPIFSVIQTYGRVTAEEMFKTFNMGIGMVIIVGKNDVDSSIKFLRKQGEKAILIGEIEKGKGKVLIK